MKFELKKPDAGMLLNVGGFVLSAVVAIIGNEKEKRAKAKAIDEAAEKAYAKVMEKMSAKN